MFKRRTLLEKALTDTEDKYLGIGVTFDTEEMLFGIEISNNLPGTLIRLGIGPFNLYIGFYDYTKEDNYA